jgi:hypothetical protein
VGSMMGSLLYTEDEDLGALNLYSRRPGAFTEASEMVGWLPASHSRSSLSGPVRPAPQTLIPAPGEFCGAQSLRSLEQTNRALACTHHSSTLDLFRAARAELVGWVNHSETAADVARGLCGRVTAVCVGLLLWELIVVKEQPGASDVQPQQPRSDAVTREAAHRSPAQNEKGQETSAAMRTDGATNGVVSPNQQSEHPRGRTERSLPHRDVVGQPQA